MIIKFHLLWDVFHIFCRFPKKLVLSQTRCDLAVPVKGVCEDSVAQEGSGNENWEELSLRKHCLDLGTLLCNLSVPVLTEASFILPCFHGIHRRHGPWPSFCAWHALSVRRGLNLLWERKHMIIKRWFYMLGRNKIQIVEKLVFKVKPWLNSW